MPASNPDIERLLKEDKGLRVVYRELPILGPDSVAAARIALAASKAGKFGHYHDALYAAGRPGPKPSPLPPGPPASADAGPRSRPGGRAQAQNELASQLGATGTPLFVVGDRVINSAVGYDELKEAIEAARAKGEVR